MNYVVFDSSALSMIWHMGIEIIVTAGNNCLNSSIVICGAKKINKFKNNYKRISQDNYWYNLEKISKSMDIIALINLV